MYLAVFVRLFAFFLLGVLFIEGTVVYGQQYFVNNVTGTDTPNSGTSSNPFKTISYSSNQITQSGAVIHVAFTGVDYDCASGESFPITMRDNMSLLGEPGMVIDVGCANEDALVLDPTSDWSSAVFSDLTIRNARRGVCTNPTGTVLNPTIENCTFEFLLFESIYFDIDAGVPTNLKIKNNTVNDLVGAKGLVYLNIEDADSSFSANIHDNAVNGINRGVQGIEILGSNTPLDGVVSVKGNNIELSGGTGVSMTKVFSVIQVSGNEITVTQGNCCRVSTGKIFAGSFLKGNQFCDSEVGATIQNFGEASVEGNSFKRCTRGLQIQPATHDLKIIENDFTDCSEYAMYIDRCDRVLISKNVTSRCGNGNSSFGSVRVNGADCKIEWHDSSQEVGFGVVADGGATNLSILNSRFIGNGFGILINAAQVTVKNCVIANTQNGPGIQDNNSEGSAYASNLIYGNAGGGLLLAASGPLSDYPGIEGNTIADNDGNGLESTLPTTMNPYVSNTICWGNTGVDLVGVSPSEHEHCNIGTGGAIGNGNISQDPLFVDPVNFDFHLMGNSPCIDIGKNRNVLTLIDLDGDPRILDGDRNGVARVDMGVDEASLVDITWSGIPVAGNSSTLTVSGPVGDSVSVYYALSALEEPLAQFPGTFNPVFGTILLDLNLLGSPAPLFNGVIQANGEISWTASVPSALAGQFVAVQAVVTQAAMGPGQLTKALAAQVE